MLSPSRHPTVVPIVTRTGPPGATVVTVSRVVVHWNPIAIDSRCLAAFSAVRSRPEVGATSWGSSETLSPAETTLPSSARRSMSAGTARITSGVPATTTEPASRSGTGETSTDEPSVRPRFPRTMSSTRITPVGASADASAANAPVVRFPLRSSGSQGDTPSAARTSRCSRTMPLRASTAVAVSLAVRVSPVWATAAD